MKHQQEVLTALKAQNAALQVGSNGGKESTPIGHADRRNLSHVTPRIRGPGISRGASGVAYAGISKPSLWKRGAGASRANTIHTARGRGPDTLGVSS